MPLTLSDMELLEVSELCRIAGAALNELAQQVDKVLGDSSVSSLTAVKLYSHADRACQWTNQLEDAIDDGAIPRLLVANGRM